MSKLCWKCKKVYEGPIHFKTTCDYCSAYLHVCKGCKYYALGKPNDCLVPGTEPIRDRESMNYCEEFKYGAPNTSSSKQSIEDISKKLFKDD